jgi:hypothetical protein
MDGLFFWGMYYSLNVLATVATTLLAQDPFPRLELNNSQTLVPTPTSYSKDDANHEYACPTGRNYEVVFYP